MVDTFFHKHFKSWPQRGRGLNFGSPCISGIIAIIWENSRRISESQLKNFSTDVHLYIFYLQNEHITVTEFVFLRNWKDGKICQNWVMLIRKMVYLGPFLSAPLPYKFWPVPKVFIPIPKSLRNCEGCGLKDVTFVHPILWEMLQNHSCMRYIVCTVNHLHLGVKNCPLPALAHTVTLTLTLFLWATRILARSTWPATLEPQIWNSKQLPSILPIFACFP